ncbi:MAG: response regulator transcription factor [Ardenticatenia bacterium]|nr:response regulator transcription factor [Ardenticatenia bacterium]
MGTIKVVLADDHAVVRQGIRDFLEESGTIAIVGEASTGEGAWQLIREHHPDVAILDVRLPDVSGLEITKRIRRHWPDMGVLILSAYDDDPFVMAALQAGANGYVLKTANADEIVTAVQAVAAGQSALDPNIVQKIMHHLSGRAAGVMLEPLTAREIEVLQLVAKGLTNREIGHRLGISDRTVQGHLANIYGKLQVNSRTEAVTRALQLGLIDLPRDG